MPWQSKPPIASVVQATLWDLTPDEPVVSEAEGGGPGNPDDPDPVPDPEPNDPGPDAGPAGKPATPARQSQAPIAEPLPASPASATPAPPNTCLTSEHTAGKLTWEDAFERYFDHLRARRCAASTIYCQQRDLIGLRGGLSAEVPGVSQVKLEHLRRYQLGLFNRRLAPATVARISTHVRMFFRFLFLEDLLPFNPSDRLEQPRVPPRPPGTVLSPGEMQKLLRGALQSKTPLRDRALLETLYCTGIRRSELLAIDVFDIDYRERTLLVKAGKGERPRVLPIPPTCFEALNHYLNLGRPNLEGKPVSALFLGVRGARLSIVGLARMLHQLSERAGLVKRVSPHCFRRTCATGLLKNGTNLKVIQAILGHSSLKTTSVYLCLSPDEIRAEVLANHPRERFEA